MRTIRSLTSFACAVLLLVASSANAVPKKYTFAGKLTSNRGKSINVPNVGNTNCGGLTIAWGPGKTGTMTPVTRVPMGINTGGALMNDRGCLPAKGVMITTTGKGVGGAFTVPPVAFKQTPSYYAPVGIHSFGVIQVVTSNTFTAPPAAVDETPGGTQATGCVGAGKTLMCKNHAKFHAFKTGAYATQTGRGGADFTWCPPNPPPNKGGPCLKIGQGGFKGIVKYNGAEKAFGGTMSYVTHEGPKTGSIAVSLGGGAAVALPFTMGNTQPTGRGYADYHTDFLAPGSVRATHMLKTRYVGPKLKNQKLITGFGPVVAMVPNGTAFNWGFPFTTKTVLVRNTGTAGGKAHNTTFTGMGYDCVNAKGPMCSVATGMNNRNISLVAGAVGLGRLPTGDTPSIAFVSMWLPEPSRTLQLLAGAIGLLGIAAWRSRRTR